MKFDWTGYYRPTPKQAQKAGLAFKAIASMTVPASLAGLAYVGIALFCLGVLGEFLTNFFVDDTQNDKPQS